MVVVACFMCGGALAQEACKAEADAQNKASQTFEAKLNEFNETNPNEPPPQVCSGGKIRWQATTAKLPYPEFGVKRSSVKFSVPETRMAEHSYSIKEPIVKCENKVVGQNPETTCRIGRWGVPQCTVRMTDIITRVCWPETRDKKIVLTTPEATMKVREFSTNVPTVTMRTKDVIFHTPQWYADSACIGQDCSRMCEDETQKQVAAANTKRNAFIQPTKVAMLKATSAVFSCNGDEIAKQRDAALAEYDKYIRVAEATLKEMLAQGLAEAAKTQDEQLVDLKRQRQAVMEQLDKAQKELSDQAEKALSAIGADQL